MKHYQEHLFDFHNMENATQTGDKNEKCLWLSERNYLLTAKLSIKAQEEFAKSVVMVWDEVKELEQLRMNVTKSVLMQYMKSRMALFSNLTSACEAYDIVGEYVPATNSVDPEKLLTNEERRILAMETGVDDVRTALTSWTLSPPPSSSLIQKEGEITYESFENEWTKSWIVVTRDNYIHMVTGKEETSELATTLNLTNANMKETYQNESYMLELEEYKASGVFSFLSSSKKIKLKFESDEERFEWRDSFASLI